jgi:hypothetical protein
MCSHVLAVLGLVVDRVRVAVPGDVARCQRSYEPHWSGGTVYAGRCRELPWRELGEHRDRLIAQHRDVQSAVTGEVRHY